MILYFSATGNSKYVAMRIASALGQDAVSLEGFPRGKAVRIELEQGEVLGLVTPVYFWNLPAFVESFLRRTQIVVKAPRQPVVPHVPAVNDGEVQEVSPAAPSAPEPPYVFTVTTYGVVSANAGAALERLLQKAGVEVTAQYSVKMPGTYTPLFDVSDDAMVERVNQAAEPQIEQVVASVIERRQGNMASGVVPVPVGAITRPLYNRARRTGKFAVTNACRGCGRCAVNCPDSAIAIQNRKPKWVKPRCDLCLRCLHQCPTFAIQRGKRTQRHGQYVNPHELS